MPWSYKTIRRDHAAGKYAPPGEVLAEAGADNWELVSVAIATQILNTGFSEIFYFKKPGPVEQE